MLIQIGCRGQHDCLKRLVILPDNFPVPRQRIQVLGLQSRVPIRKPHCLYDRIEIWLRRSTRHRGQSRIGNIESHIAGHQDRCRLNTCRIMRVEMNRDPNFLLQCLHKFGSGRRLAQTRHILNGQQVCPPLLQFPGKTHIVFEVILRATRIKNISRVTNRRFAEHACFANRIHGDSHVRCPVERIKDTENIHSRSSRFFDEFDNNIVGIVRVSHRVRSS